MKKWNLYHTLLHYYDIIKQLLDNSHKERQLSHGKSH